MVVFVGFTVAGIAVGVMVLRERPEPSAAARPAPAPVPEAVPDADAPEAEPAPFVPRSPALAPGPASAPVEAPRELGRLRIDSDVPGANVFLDREFIGTTPVVAEGVPPGAHRLNVSADGYDGVAETIDVEPGPREILIRLAEVRLDAAVAVVHDHRFGECAGQLVATPDGLRYETTNENDGFAVSLLDLETFDVDYLEKTLTVEIARGRRYTFTDPEDDADRLFVFHRDVARAAEQLAR